MKEIQEFYSKSVKLGQCCNTDSSNIRVVAELMISKRNLQVRLTEIIASPGTVTTYGFLISDIQTDKLNDLLSRIKFQWGNVPFVTWMTRSSTAALESAKVVTVTTLGQG